MKRPTGPLPVTIALALGSMALGAATLSPQAPARATPPVQAAQATHRVPHTLPVSSGDSSVPPASGIRFPPGEPADVPTF